MGSLKWNPWRLYAVKTFVEFPASPRMPSCACSSSKPLSLLPHSFGQFDPWMVVESVGSGATFSALCGRKIQPGGNLFVRFRLRIYFGRVWSRVDWVPKIVREIPRGEKVTSQPWHGWFSSKFVCFLGCRPHFRPHQEALFFSLKKKTIGVQ